MSETLLTSLTITVVGVFIVFTVLFILVFFVSFLKRIDEKWDERKNQKENNSHALMEEPAAADNSRDLVLISAAVAAYFKGRAIIRRVRVLPNVPRQGGLWALQARTVLQSSHVTKK